MQLIVIITNNLYLHRPSFSGKKPLHSSHWHYISSQYSTAVFPGTFFPEIFSYCEQRKLRIWADQGALVCEEGVGGNLIRQSGQPVLKQKLFHKRITLMEQK